MYNPLSAKLNVKVKTVHTLTCHFSMREKQTDETNEQRPF